MTLCRGYQQIFADHANTSNSVGAEPLNNKQRIFICYNI